ncbi:MAG: LytTR family DNA-binding domain-containing protein [Candidatus Tenebribacter davisii]|jgi:DNA-binding LytR/AlgR family response regulator|nr:LytTR family DNA-binding domain-containing protein [Candidatus Tenebribacter davisii]
MKIIIIEDEIPAAERLEKLIINLQPAAEILIVLDSVKRAVEWFGQNNEYDLVFMDIHLADGLSFNIFQKVKIEKPIIFTTAYDEYALEAFEVNSIDYLLKPISESRLQKSFAKVELLKGENDNKKMMDILNSLQNRQQHYKSRFLVKVGSVLHPISVDKISLFYIDNQLIKLQTLKGNNYVLDQSLDDIENGLNPEDFFRISRQMIVAAASIRKIESFFSSRLILTLDPEHSDVIVSKRKVTAFKLWME